MSSLNQNVRQERIEAIGEQLRLKINSKFQTTVFLAGFSFTILGIQLTLLWSERSPALLPHSIAVMGGASLFYIAGLYCLDGLTMPKRFWDEDPNEKDKAKAEQAYLTQNDLRALKKRMVYYWFHLTLAGVGATVISFVLLLWPFGRFGPSLYSLELVAEAALLTLIAVVAVVGYLCWLKWDHGRREKRWVQKTEKSKQRKPTDPILEADRIEEEDFEPMLRPDD